MSFYLYPNVGWVNYMDEKEGWREGISRNMGIDQFLTEMFQTVHIAHLLIVSITGFFIIYIGTHSGQNLIQLILNSNVYIVFDFVGYDGLFSLHKQNINKRLVCKSCSQLVFFLWLSRFCLHHHHWGVLLSFRQQSQVQPVLFQKLWWIGLGHKVSPAWVLYLMLNSVYSPAHISVFVHAVHYTACMLLEQLMLLMVVLEDKHEMLPLIWNLTEGSENGTAWNVAQDLDSLPGI